MVFANCHEGKGIICLDEENASSPCKRNPQMCGWAKYADIEYIFKSITIDSGRHVEPIMVKIPSNAIAINTAMIDNSHDRLTWLEPATYKKSKEKGYVKISIIDKDITGRLDPELILGILKGHSRLKGSNIDIDYEKDRQGFNKIRITLNGECLSVGEVDTLLWHIFPSTQFKVSVKDIDD